MVFSPGGALASAELADREGAPVHGGDELARQRRSRRQWLQRPALATSSLVEHHGLRARIDCSPFQAGLRP
jgi:hypothetical protein